MSIIEEIVGIIISPRKTLESISKKEDITSAFIIVLITGILYKIYFTLSPYTQAIFEMFEIEITTTILIITFAILLILDLIMWIIFAGMCRFISILFGGTGNYEKILQLSGYSHAIYFVLSPIYMLVMMALPTLSTPISLIGLIWVVTLIAFVINIAENISLIKAFLIGIISYFIVYIVLSYGAFIYCISYLI